MLGNRIGNTLFVTLPADCDAEVLSELSAQVATDVFTHRDGRVIIDAVAVELLDAEDAAGLVAMCRTITLLGARPVVAGLRPEVVAALISMQIDLAGIDCCLDIAAAVERR